MTGFRILLIALLVSISIYTGIVAYKHGLGLFPVFFGDIAAMAWPGQFNLDFTCLLILSAVWVAWRHHFSVPGLILGLAALILGAMFLTVYLLVATWTGKGDVKELLLGPVRARA